MEPRPVSLLTNLAVLAVIIGAFAFLVRESASQVATPAANVATSTQVSAAASASTSMVVEMVPAAPPVTTTTPAVKTTVKKMPKQSQEEAAPGAPEAMRIIDAYDTPPLSFDDINAAARLALVNIFCAPHSGGLRPISGSGIVIDPQGVILTNAHVAQYVLLSESRRVDLSCYVRTGSPATAHWVPKVLYIPATWVETHAADINSDHPLGTGEHDYALLSIAVSVDGSPLPAFPSVSPDTREAIAFIDDPVLVASYPAEFAGGSVQSNLYPVSSITSIAQFLTFGSGLVDVISVGSVIEAQSGSSGGAVVNAWGRLVGIITTTSEGATTADRELRAITTAYVNRDLLAQTGSGLTATLSGDISAKTDDFTARQAPSLIQLFMDQFAK